MTIFFFVFFPILLSESIHPFSFIYLFIFWQALLMIVDIPIIITCLFFFSNVPRLNLVGLFFRFHSYFIFFCPLGSWKNCKLKILQPADRSLVFFFHHFFQKLTIGIHLQHTHNIMEWYSRVFIFNKGR